MKKNKMMRIASVLLVAVLISTCAISGTFAKYVTRVEGEDTARVAKWGILLTVDGDAFGTEYKATDAAYLAADGTISVESSNEEKVVAPGTSSDNVSEKAVKYVATVAGTPEVATRYTLEGKGIKDVVLPAGTYKDYTNLVKAADGTWGYTDTFTLAKDYAPVKWNLVITKGNTQFNVAEDLYDALKAESEELLAKAESYGFTKKGCSFFDAVAILAKVAPSPIYKQVVETALGKIVSGGRNFTLEANKQEGTFKLGYDFDPNKTMGFTFELTWAWAFEQEDNADTPINETELFDKADTFLGNYAAYVVDGELEGFDASEVQEGTSIVIAADLIATATQID